jgi:hypothetical protein
MPLREFLKTCADFVELLDFAQDRSKRHIHRSLAGTPKREELQMDWLGSEDLKEENVVIAPAVTIPRLELLSASEFTRDRFVPSNSQNTGLQGKVLIMEDHIEQ